MNAQSLLQAGNWRVSGLGPIGSDGVNLTRAVNKVAAVGWHAPPGRYTFVGNAYVRGCGTLKVTLGDAQVRVTDNQVDDDGYQQFYLSGQVNTPAHGLSFAPICRANSTVPILLYRADLYRITPPPAPAWERPLGVGLVMLLLYGLVWLLGVRRLS